LRVPAAMRFLFPTRNRVAAAALAATRELHHGSPLRLKFDGRNISLQS
jgi:hypothetical protein